MEAEVFQGADHEEWEAGVNARGGAGFEGVAGGAGKLLLRFPNESPLLYSKTAGESSDYYKDELLTTDLSL